MFNVFCQYRTDSSVYAADLSISMFEFTNENQKSKLELRSNAVSSIGII